MRALFLLYDSLLRSVARFSSKTALVIEGESWLGSPGVLL
jgi:hypothetical protein